VDFATENPADPTSDTLVLHRKSGKPRSAKGFILAFSLLSFGVRNLHILAAGKGSLIKLMVLATVGALGAMWALKSGRQRITLCRSAATILFEEGPWYAPRRSTVYARSVRAVEVEAEPGEVDPQSDARIYRVMLCVLDGRRLPLTDYGDWERVSQQRQEILAYLPPGLSRRF
jgi:hypothetical protein